MNVYRDNAKPIDRPPPRETQPLPAVASAPEPWSFKTRDDFPELMNQWGLTGVGVEVGVYRGGFSNYLLKHWPGVLHCVDPWEYHPDRRDMLNTPDQPSHYEYAVSALGGYVAEGRCVIHRDYSVGFAGDWAPLRDGLFDWVYIDALHDYQNCLDDCRAWAPLIASGGALCGHDYLDHATGPDTVTEFGVKSAVRQWCEESGYDVARDVLTTTDDGYPTWVIRLR